MTPLTPTEQAWADLCDERENPDVERVVAATGGWDAWTDVPVSYRAFTAACNGDTSVVLAEREEALARAAD